MPFLQVNVEQEIQKQRENDPEQQTVPLVHSPSIRSLASVVPDM